MNKDLHILINNEEVVCDKNITINEEMLSTSSTILKNCYPKSWETTKDYVSNFYFPKDYSKCKIFNEIYHPEIPGSTVSGSNLSINYDNTLNYEIQELKGNTYQQTNPTPTNPKPINNVTGRQTIDVVGKNLFDKDTMTLNMYFDAGTMTLKSNSDTRIAYTKVPKNTNVTISKTSVTNRFRIGLSNQKPQLNSSYVQSSYWQDDVSTLSATINTENYDYVLVQYTNTGQDTNVQIEKGSTATTYEEYKGQSYEINLGKNLFDKDNANLIDAYLNPTGTKISSASGVKTLYISCKPNTTYTVSKVQSDRFVVATGTSVEPNSVMTSFVANYTATNITVTSGANDKYLVVFFYRQSGDTLTPEEIMETIQIEQGSTASSYSSYFTPIELNKIGNYQDSIKKSTGKNLFDKDNITNGIFYDTTDGHIINTGAWTQSSFINATSGEQITIQSDYTTTNNSFLITQFDENQNWLRGQQFSLQTGKTTFTLGTNTKYIKIGYRNDRVNPNTLMLNEGSTALPYEPYGKVWYIGRNIGKVDFGTINWNSAGHQAPGYRRYYTNTIPNVKYVSRNFDLGIGLAEKYKIHTGNGMGSKGSENCFAIDVSMVQAVDQTAPSGLLYYALATPTYEVITNTDLINQLESIRLLKGINNISVISPNEFGLLQIHYNYKEAYTTEDLIFCGLVKNTGNISLNPREPHYVDLQLLDFKDLLSTGETLNYVITGKTIVEAIEQVVASISDYGFIVGNINILRPDDIINAYSTLNKTAYDVFQYIADITQSRWTTRVVDENTIAIDFYDPTLMPQADAIEYTKEYFEENDIENMTFNYSTNDYRNKQIMTSNEVYANITQTETLISNGYQDSYMAQNKIGIITSITVNGTPATFATKSEEELGVSADFIYQPGEMTFNAKTTYSAGTSIVITYYPIVKGREIVLNNEENVRIQNQINRKGTISRYENRNDTTSSQELIKIGQSYIKYKGKAEISLKIVSSNNLFNIGQIVEFNAPLEELSTEYMVKSKTIEIITTIDKIFYTFELSSNFNSENAINYFDNQRAKNQGNIGEGETISRAIDLEDTAVIKFYDTSIEEIEVGTVTSLDFSLDSVLI